MLNLKNSCIMEIKKSIRASLENKRLLFVEAGLVLSLALVYSLLEWAVETRPAALLADNTRLVEEDDIVAIQLNTPPPPPALPEVPRISDVLEIVEDDIDLDVEFQDLTEENGQELIIHPYTAVEEEEEEEVDEVIPMVLVETKPSFNGGDANEFSKWVNSRLVYPELAKENGVQGKVTLQFTIGTDGRLSAVKVLKGADPLLDEEAIRVVSSSPKWTPGKQRDRAVKVSYTFPVIFSLR